MKNENHQTKKRAVYSSLVATIAILVAIFFLSTSLSPALSGTASPAEAYQASGIEPNPVMNTNVTWSTFYHGWNSLEYSNGTGNLTLQTNMSSFYKNPIIVNPQDIQTPNNKIKNINPYNKTLWNTNNGVTALGASETITNTTHSISLEVNTSAAGGTEGFFYMNIPVTDMPSTDTSYDYITLMGNTTLPATGIATGIEIGNHSTGTILSGKNGTAAIGKQGSLTTECEPITNSTPFYTTINLKQANLTLGSTNIKIGLSFALPTSSTEYYLHTTITDIQISTTPYFLGTTQSNNTETHTTYETSNDNLQTFNPDFAWTSITNGGYTVATSQVLQNITTSQSSINSGNYIEQVTYQGQLSLPTAPDLSLTNTNITMPISISGSQFIVANLNGVSYTSTLNGMKNGTLAFGNVNPNNANTIVLEVDYTASQWNSFTGAPAFFSIAGIEYYWWVALIGIMSAIGLGSFAKSRWGGTESNLRGPKGRV